MGELRKKVDALRVAKKVSMKEIARALGVSDRTIYNLLDNDNLQVEYLKKLSSLFKYDFLHDDPVGVYPTKEAAREIPPFYQIGEINQKLVLNIEFSVNNMRDVSSLMAQIKELANRMGFLMK